MMISNAITRDTIETMLRDALQGRRVDLFDLCTIELHALPGSAGLVPIVYIDPEFKVKWERELAAAERKLARAARRRPRRR